MDLGPSTLSPVDCIPRPPSPERWALWERIGNLRTALVTRMLGGGRKLDSALWTASGRLLALAEDKHCPDRISEDGAALAGLSGRVLAEAMQTIVDRYRDEVLGTYRRAGAQPRDAPWADETPLPAPGVLDFAPLESAIARFGMCDIWGDSFETLTTEESEARIAQRKAEAVAAFTRLMQASSNDGTVSYEDWAVRKTLGLHTYGYTAQPTGRKNWQAWGPRVTS